MWWSSFTCRHTRPTIIIMTIILRENDPLNYHHRDSRSDWQKSVMITKHRWRRAAAGVGARDCKERRGVAFALIRERR